MIVVNGACDPVVKTLRISAGKYRWTAADEGALGLSNGR